MGDLSTPHTSRLGGQSDDRTHGALAAAGGTHGACLLKGISFSERADVSAGRRLTVGACLLEGISPSERPDVSADRRLECRGRSGGGGFGTGIGTGISQESAGMPEAALRVVCHRHLSLK